MREPPSGVAASQIAAAVSAGWALGPTNAEHLSLGFGAHHWRVVAADVTLFATLDTARGTRGVDSFEDAYAATADLGGQGLEFVVASCRAVRRTFTVPFGPGCLSCTPWLSGMVVGDGPLTTDAEATATAEMLGRLHAATPPARLPRWQARVTADLPDDLERLAATAWTTGPFGPGARAALLPRLPAIRSWTAGYRRLVTVARTRP